MKKTIWNPAALLLAMVLVFSVLTVPAFAKSDKSVKPGKEDQEISSSTCDGFTAITLDQAKEIALGHAGVNSADAVFSKAKLDKTVYELKFSALGVKYEYEISADGTIRSGEADTKEPHGTSDSSPTPPIEAEISQLQARQIALDDAGLDGETLKYVTCFVAWVDHAPYGYEVKFATRAASYHYTIDLNSGAILSSSCTPHR